MLLVMSSEQSGPFIHAFPLPSFVPTSFVVFAASAALAEPRIKWEVINSLPLMPPPSILVSLTTRALKIPLVKIQRALQVSH